MKSESLPAAPRPTTRRLAESLIPHPGTIIAVVLLMLLFMWAQASGALAIAPLAPMSTNTTIPYQGRISDAEGNQLTGTTDMTFALYSTSAGGTALWQETWSGAGGVPVVDGFFSVMLGTHSPLPQALFTQNLATFLGIRVGADPEMTPRVQLGSVPYALAVADASVTTPKIADGAVTADKLAAGLSGVPTRTIVMWSGTLNTVPAGWQICDGTNGTPDLMDKFILGVADGQDPGETGGSHTKSLSVANLPAHQHTFTTSENGSHSHKTHIEDDGGFSSGTSKSGADDTSGDGISTSSNGSHSHSGTTNPTGSGTAFDIRPAYYRLAFIMKIN